MKNNKHPFLKWAGIVFLVLGLIYAGLVVAGNMAVRREKAALEAAGFPMRLEQFIPAAIPEKDNAAPLYNAAFKALKEQPRVEFEGAEADGGSPNNLLDQLRQTACAFLKAPDDAEAAKNFETLVRDPRVTDFLASFERASALPGYRQDNDYAATGPEMSLPHIWDNLCGSQILAALALQQMRQGNTAAAWRTVELSFRFADTLRDEPIGISQLVRISQQSIAIEAMKDLVEVSAPTDEISQKIQKQLSSFDGEEAATLALAGERIGFGEWAFSQSPVSLGNWMRKWPFGEEVSFPYSSTLASVVFGPLLQPWDNAAFLQAWREILRRGENAVSENESSSYLQNIPGFFALTRWSVPKITGLKTRLSYADSAAIVGRLGLAAIEYKRAHGTFPPDLRAIGAQNALDPFTGKPFAYRPEANGFLLYSVGPDLTDDGGVQYDNKTSTGDFVWRYIEKAG